MLSLIWIISFSLDSTSKEQIWKTVFRGKINGRVSLKAKGKNGFGYDPIFIPENCEKTFAEMKPLEKNKISHRKIAVTKLKSFLF